MRRSGFIRQTAAARFDVRSAYDRAAVILRDPPARRHIVRVKPVGDLVARFALPLEVCEPQNARRKAPGWAMAQKRDDILHLFALQLCGHLPTAPLTGRPIVQCIRFSSRAPDAFADSFKLAVDCLSPSRIRRHKGVPRLIRGIGLIADDRPEVCDVRQRWEYAARGTGFCLVELWSGEKGGGG
jgi:hypothetical protein